MKQDLPHAAPQEWIPCCKGASRICLCALSKGSTRELSAQLQLLLPLQPAPALLNVKTFWGIEAMVSAVVSCQSNRKLQASHLRPEAGHAVEPLQAARKGQGQAVSLWQGKAVQLTASQLGNCLLQGKSSLHVCPREEF